MDERGGSVVVRDDRARRNDIALVREVAGRDNNLMNETGTVRQCPYCELRFTYHNEVKEHICRDHREHADVVALIEPHELPHG